MSIASGAGSGSTTSTSFQDIVTATIDPIHTDSHIMVIATGVVQGNAGNNNNNRSTGAMQLTRGNSAIGEQFESSGHGSASTSGIGVYFTQTFHDTHAHNGGAQTYRLKLRKSSGGFSPNVKMGGAPGNTNNTQGSARLLLVEVLR